MKTLEELKKEECELQAQLKANRLAQEDIRRQDKLIELGLFIGDKVIYMDKGKVIRGVLTSIDVSYSFCCYPMVTKYNKDGSLGKRETRIWKYEEKTLQKDN